MKQPFIVMYYSGQLAVQMANNSAELLDGSEVISVINYETAKELVVEMNLEHDKINKERNHEQQSSSRSSV